MNGGPRGATTLGTTRFKPSQPRALLRRLRGTEVGQALVEFTFVLPLFLVLLFALVDFGRGFYAWLLITNASREGARAAAVGNDGATVDAKIYASFCSATPPTAANCALDPADITITKVLLTTRGEQVTVTLTYDYDYVTPLKALNALLGSTVRAEPTLVSPTNMRGE